MIKRALWLEKPQYSSDFPASYLSPSLGEVGRGSASSSPPPWERQGKAPQVSSPLLGRGRGRLLKSALPSLGEAREGSSSRLSPPWEGQGEAPQVSTPLPWGGAGGGFLLFSFTNAFAGRGVLKNKRITVGNTRVLSLFATH